LSSKKTAGSGFKEEKEMRKKILGIILAICMLASLTACSSKPQQETTTGFKPALDKNTSCSITVVGSYDNFEALEAEFDRFKEFYPNVQLSYVKLDDYNNVLGTALDGNDLGIYYSRSRDRSIVMLYRQRSVITFDLSAGTIDTNSGQSYSGYAITRGDIVFLDTAGRLHIDEALMAELQQIRDAVEPAEILLILASLPILSVDGNAPSRHRVRLGLDAPDSGKRIFAKTHKLLSFDICISEIIQQFGRKSRFLDGKVVGVLRKPRNEFLNLFRLVLVVCEVLLQKHIKLADDFLCDCLVLRSFGGFLLRTICIHIGVGLRNLEEVCQKIPCTIRQSRTQCL